MPTSLTKLVLTLASAAVLFGAGVLLGVYLSRPPEVPPTPKLGQLPKGSVIVEEIPELEMIVEAEQDPDVSSLADSAPVPPREIIRTVTVPGKPEPEAVRALAEALVKEKLESFDLPLNLDLSFRVTHNLKRFETEKETGWIGTGSCEFFSKKRNEWVALVTEELDENLSIARKAEPPSSYAASLTKHAVTLEGSYGSGGWGSEAGYDRRIGTSRLWVGVGAGTDESLGWRVFSRLRLEWR